MQLTNLLILSQLNLILISIVLLINASNAASIYNDSSGQLIIKPTNEIKKPKERKPTAPRASFFTETFLFDRVFYYFPFGYYSKFKTYNSTGKYAKRNWI